MASCTGKRWRRADVARGGCRRVEERRRMLPNGSRQTQSLVRGGGRGGQRCGSPFFLFFATQPFGSVGNADHDGMDSIFETNEYRISV